MAIIDGFRGELEWESAATRSMLERLPEDRLDWRPHPKSFTMRQLASHLADVSRWMVPLLTQTEATVDPATHLPWECTGVTDLLARYDENIRAALAAMDNVSDEHMLEYWSLKLGHHVAFTMPRAAVMRGMIMNHTIHHRAQLTVYYRMNDIPLPSIYGPSADER